MAGILLNNVSKQYGKFKEFAVKDFNLDIEDQEFLVFLGPSGCGKSTTLRMVAGLEDITGGEIFIGDTLVNDIPPKDRDISMVFQNYALYPNLSVYENIAFGLRIRKVPKFEIEDAVKRAARVLEIGSFLDRKPRELSGGQRQRVALGRAIVRQPQAFLMDEPLSNLDAKLRVQMRAEIIRLHKAIGVTTIYVTHDQIEAMTMGDRIVVMNRGIIQQVDTPEVIYNRPQNMFVAKFIGNQPMNFFNGTIREIDGHIRFFTKAFNLRLTDEQAAMMRNKRMHDYEVVMGIRPEHIGVERELLDYYPHATIKGFLQFNEFIGSDHYYHVDAYGKESFTVRAHPRYRYDEGDEVTVAVDMGKALFFDKNSQELMTD
ncbi:ABC transporter ATP-binding protein [Lederbergia sp. NSJ-179]|uniref:ABC transporter ATP-binding protein n=1 Tax=Lederbergia sp. NSJ-179 TaxID=2931402 RepID=UPI001FD58646|nr:ABC transporter ATP-binding protein [Lederbergia sp. NSJ-179]MCJ7840787.1 ABC transporter ATP-binding protein [Lederbergia sp. NSJ-179]